MSFADNRANIKQAGLSSVKFKLGADIAYYPWPFIKEGKVRVSDLVSENETGRPFGHSILWEAEFTAMTRDTAAVDMKLLDDIISNKLHVKIACIDGTTYSSELIDATLGYVGCSWEYVNSGSYNSEEQTKFKLMQAMTRAQLATMMGSPPADGTPNAGDMLYSPFNSGLTIVDILPAAVTKVELKETTNGSWTDAFNTVRNMKVSLKSLTTRDEHLRELGHGASIDISGEFMQASTSEVPTDYNTIIGRDNDVRLTLANGNQLTFDSIVNVKLDIVNEGGPDKTSYLALTAMGKIPLSSWNGIWP